MDDSARWAIYRLLVDYADAIDTRDRERVGRCFTVDATATYAGTAVGPGREVIVEYLWEQLTSRTSTHFVGNVQIDFTGATTATTNSFVMATHLVGDGDAFRLKLRGLRYLDEVVLVGDAWQIRTRRHVPVWATEMAGESFV
jgi:SnoaL-like domain